MKTNWLALSPDKNPMKWEVLGTGSTKKNVADLKLQKFLDNLILNRRRRIQALIKAFGNTRYYINFVNDLITLK